MPSDTKVITGEVRLSYARLITPKANDKGTDVWSVLLLIPKKDKVTIAKLRAAAEKALETGLSNGKIKKGTSLKNAWTTLKDGDERDDLDEAPEYADTYYMNVNAYRQPGVVIHERDEDGDFVYENGKKKLVPITDERDIYSGCYAKASISAYPFNYENTKRGITFGLENILKIRDGEPLGGAAASPDSDFADEGGDGDDPLI